MYKELHGLGPSRPPNIQDKLVPVSQCQLLALVPVSDLHNITLSYITFKVKKCLSTSDTIQHYTNLETIEMTPRINEILFNFEGLQGI